MPNLDAGAADELWVFVSGILGPGVMGFQPAIFDNKAGESAWIPFWDHFTVKWVDEASARVLTNSTEIRDLIESGEFELFNGVPDSHPNGFVVNCPAPILAPNMFRGSPRLTVHCDKFSNGWYAFGTARSMTSIRD